MAVVLGEPHREAERRCAGRQDDLLGQTGAGEEGEGQGGTEKVGGAGAAREVTGVGAGSPADAEQGVEAAGQQDAGEEEGEGERAAPVPLGERGDGGTEALAALPPAAP
ncbi:hypothetical protein [Streptomyces sp. ADI93-02]|uniref:hypothetical protein n=1 Tax=Streptomyces sp. ADI93-02 TaxID=1522757 RepID=UPI000F54E49D|nr:hypothetical protein [Streptomyces sp. ADI93-02]